MPHWSAVYIGVGSNLDDPRAQVVRALAALGALPQTQLVRVSSLYGSRPLGPIEQPDYVNAAAALLSQLQLPVFFQALRALETQLGREPPRVRWGARRIDLDLLIFGEQRSDSAELQLPHPGIVQRNFVLYPLCELAPELIVPGQGRVAALTQQVSPAGIWRLDHASNTHVA